MRLGEMLKERRVALGFTTLEVSKHIPMDESYLKQIESGSAIPGEQVLRNIVEALDLDPVSLESLRRVEYVERNFDRSRKVTPITTKMPVFPKLSKEQPNEEHKCQPDKMLAKGHQRLCVVLPPEVWQAFMELKQDLYQFSGVEPTLRSLAIMTILSVHNFKKNQPKDFKFVIKDFGDMKL